MNEYDIFVHNRQTQGLYDESTQTIEMNNSMATYMKRDNNIKLPLVIIGEEEDKSIIYGTIKDFPVTMYYQQRIINSSRLYDMRPTMSKHFGKDDSMIYHDLTSDGVWEWFPETNFEYMSPHFWNILGYEQRDMDENPNSWMGMLNSEDQEVAMTAFREHTTSRGKKPYNCQIRYRHAKEKHVHILCRGSVTDWLPNGKPWRMIGTHTDITDMVEKDAVEAQSKFVARMSHEIRSPLCTILNECESTLPDRDTIVQSCTHLLSITDDVLALSKLQNLEMKLDKKEVALHEVFNMCIKRHKKEADKKNISLRMSSGDLPPKVCLDLMRVNQVLDNLVTNSIKYSSGGRIMLDTEYDFDTSIVTVLVEDNGIGIPEEIKETVFDEFVQGSNTMQGVGIGLAICKKLAGMMGGEISVQKTKIDYGTTMRFTFLANISEQSDEDSVWTKDIHKVLIVDDMEINRKILTQRLLVMDIFDLEKLNIVEASDGKEAVDIFTEHNGDFDLVLMDCMMPIMDGFSATIEIHNICSKMGIEAVPVVAVTASLSTDIYDKCHDSGMVCVVTKPYTVTDLVASVYTCKTQRKSI